MAPPVLHRHRDAGPHGQRCRAPARCRRFSVTPASAWRLPLPRRSARPDRISASCRVCGSVSARATSSAAPPASEPHGRLPGIREIAPRAFDQPGLRIQAAGRQRARRIDLERFGRCAGEQAARDVGGQRRQLRGVRAERAHHQRPARCDQPAREAAVRAQRLERRRGAERRDQQVLAGNAACAPISPAQRSLPSWSGVV